MGLVIRTATRGAQQQIRRVAAVGRTAARGPVARVYAQVERDFGMLAPPVSLHAAAPGPLAASWLMLRETLLARGLVPRPVKEAVAVAVSLGNACPYCVQVHSGTLSALVRPADAVAVGSGRTGAVGAADLRAAAEWARACGTAAGAAGHPPPGPAGHLPELIGVAVTFQYLNRMAHLFLADSPLPAAVPAAARGVMLRVLGRLMRPAASRVHRPGDSLYLLPTAPLPADLGWAQGNPTIAEAFGRAAAAIDSAGARSVPDQVRGLIRADLARWDGRPAGASRAWVEAAVSALPAADQAAGRLALLTARAPYQVDDRVVQAFRAARPDDAALVELTSWASLAAARRAGGWMLPAATGPVAAVAETG
jgi:alkylhydroperoxidase family enzyme